jgi:hypothetical protein
VNAVSSDIGERVDARWWIKVLLEDGGDVSDAGGCVLGVATIKKKGGIGNVLKPVQECTGGLLDLERGSISKGPFLDVRWIRMLRPTAESIDQACK